MDTPAYLKPGMKEWLLGLPATARLYTSVIPWNPEKCTYKVSCPTDMSPTAILTPRGCMPGTCTAVTWAGEVYPGYGMTGGPGRAIPGTHPVPSQDPYLHISKAKGPTHGQMKAIMGPSYTVVR